MEKKYYRIYGLTLASDYEFPQFISIDEPVGGPDIEIEYGGISDEIMNYLAQGYYAGHKNHDKWFSNKAGVFWIHDDRKINFIEYDEGTVDDAAQYLPGMCLSILLWFRKMIMIHGACLRYKDKTIVIAGDSGSGKSTLTTELIKKGAKLIADDVTGIGSENGEYYSYPAFPAQKLCMDQVERNDIDTTGLRQIRYDLNKYEIPREDQFYDQKSKVDRFFRVEPRKQLDNESGLELQTISGAEKLKTVTNSIFIKWLFHDNFGVEPDDIARCIGFIKDIPVFRVIRDKRKDTLADIISFIDEQTE